MIDGAWIDERGRVLEIVSAGAGQYRVTARPGEGEAPFPPSNVLSEDTVEARDLPAVPCEARYPMPPGSPCITVETGAPGYGRTLRLTLVAVSDEGVRAPRAGDPEACLRVVPEIGPSYLDAVAYHESEECYERLPWAEPVGPYRRAR